MTSTIVFDFDGTLAVGNGPVLAYARAMAPHADGDFLARVEQTLCAFDAGRIAGYRDGYDIVATLGTQAGVPVRDQQAAYLASRELLGTTDATVNAAPGLADLLRALPASVRIVLATNAPDLGVERVLTTWGVREHFDELRFAVGKPDGLGPIIREHLERGPVLSVGDIVENDLAPAAARGADTALVGATTATASADVTMRATTFDLLAPQIAAWAGEPPTLLTHPATAPFER